MTLEQKIQSCLTEDLLSPKWFKRERKTRLDGHCYIAAEAAYHLYGKKHGYKPKVISVDDWTHWYLEHSSGAILDPTAGQFVEETPPYHLGRGCGFLTSKPSKRAKVLIKRIKKSCPQS